MTVAARRKRKQNRRELANSLKKQRSVDIIYHYQGIKEYPATFKYGTTIEEVIEYFCEKVLKPPDVRYHRYLFSFKNKLFEQYDSITTLLDLGIENGDKILVMKNYGKKKDKTYEKDKVKRQKEKEREEKDVKAYKLAMLNQMKYDREQSMRKPIKIHVIYKDENGQKIIQTQYVNIFTTMNSIIARFLREKLGVKNYTKVCPLYELWFKGVPVEEFDTISKIQAVNNDNFKLLRKSEEEDEDFNDETDPDEIKNDREDNKEFIIEAAKEEQETKKEEIKKQTKAVNKILNIKKDDKDEKVTRKDIKIAKKSLRKRFKKLTNNEEEDEEEEDSEEEKLERAPIRIIPKSQKFITKDGKIGTRDHDIAVISKVPNKPKQKKTQITDYIPKRPARVIKPIPEPKRSVVRLRKR